MDDRQIPANIRALVFDIGETLVDESRMWSEQARQAGVTPFALMGLVGAMIVQGENHDAAWHVLGCDRPSTSWAITLDDLYPDALGCLNAARSAGLIVGIAGNQPTGVIAGLQELGFDADFVASSGAWGISKPAGEFFRRIINVAGVAPHEIMYIGDRLDNDIIPARAAGMRTAHIRRGPWGYLHACRPDIHVASIRINSLDQLTTALRGY